MEFISTPSPNFNARKSDIIDMLVLHYTDTTSAAEALSLLTSEPRQVSAHYLVDEDGSIHHIVDEEHRAWHAGLSYWRGVTDVNSRSIGIEIQNPGHGHGYRPFPDRQMQSVIKLCQAVLKRHPIPARNVIAHSDIAPDRKSDPGELFNWRLLAEQGIGLFPDCATHSEVSIPDPFDLHQSLTDYGYNPELGEDIVLKAFQRHFEPEVFSQNKQGIPTDKTAGLITMLLNQARSL